MHPRTALAHQTGAVYLVFAILGTIGEFGFPSFIVPGDAAGTARAIAGAESLYRLSLAFDFVTMVLFLVLVVMLFELLGEVNRGLAILMVVLVSVGVTLTIGNFALRAVPLVFGNGGDALAALSPPQQEALSLAALRLHGIGARMRMAFWGFWLVPLGLLVIRSRFVPRLVGILLLVAGGAYIVTSFAALLYPDYRQLVTRVMMPLFFGELPVIFWLLIKGARPPQVPETGLNEVSAHGR